MRNALEREKDYAMFLRRHEEMSGPKRWNPNFHRLHHETYKKKWENL